jgi:hypothetical protein
MRGHLTVVAPLSNRSCAVPSQRQEPHVSRWHDTPHPPSAPSPLEKHEGRRRSIEEHGMTTCMCEPAKVRLTLPPNFTTASPPRAPSPPRFSVGEKVAKPDEGAQIRSAINDTSSELHENAAHARTRCTAAAQRECTCAPRMQRCYARMQRCCAVTQHCYASSATLLR